MFCQVTVLLGEILAYAKSYQDHDEPKPGEVDVGWANDFYRRLKALGDSLPPALRHDHNLTPQTCYLGYVGLSIAPPPSPYQKNPNKLKRIFILPTG